MSDRIEIKATEIGVVRVFDVDLDPAEAKAFNRRNGNWPVQQALGATTLDPGHVDLIKIEDLEGYGLTGYLAQGMGVSDHDLEDTHAILDGLTGFVLVVGSSAFGRQAQVLTPRAPLHLVATFNEDKPPVSFEKLPDGGAAGTASGPKTARS
ncbi:MAG: hypothetical protein AAFW87_05505, partial [Pseudomonadota bacterium]